MIPAHGESLDQVETLLEAVFLQRSSCFKLGKVILCSDDALIQERFSQRSSVLFVGQEKHSGKPDALNRMLRESSADFCIQNSADCVPGSELSYHYLLRPLLDPGVGAVSGHPVPFTPGFLGLPVVVWRCHDFVQPKLSGEMFSFSRSQVEELPLDVVHDDAFLHHELVRRGYQVVFEPRAVVFNSPPETFSDYYAQRKKNVMGNFQLMEKFSDLPPGVLRLRSMIMMALELIVNLHGRLDYLRGKMPSGLIGYSLKSTKNLKNGDESA